MGALTSKPYAFTARPWELRNIETIDIGDTECVPIRLQLKGNQILRVLPLINNHTKSDWISDRARFSYDGFYNQRLTTIVYTNQFFRKQTNNFFNQTKSLNWVQALTFLGRYVAMRSTRMLFLVQRTLSVSEWLSLERKASSRGQSHLLFAQPSEVSNFSSDLVPFFSLPEADQKFQKTNLVVTIGLNLREQFPILYTNLRQRFLNDPVFKYYYIMANNIDSHSDSDFGINLGNYASPLWKILEGKHPLSKELLMAENPLILVGGITQSNSYFFNFMSVLHGLTNRIFHLANSKITIGFLSTDGNHLETHYEAIGLYNCRQYWKMIRNKPKVKLNSNYNGFKNLTIRSNPLIICYNVGLPNAFAKHTFDSKVFDFIVYHSSHYQSEVGFGVVDLALPELAPFEKSGFYYNYTGFGQESTVVVPLDTDTKVLKPIGLDYIWDTWFFKEYSLLNPTDDERPVVSANSFEAQFSETLAYNAFLANTSYGAQSKLFYFFGNVLNDYDCLLTDDLSRNSPTLNLMKNLKSQSQLNFIN